MTSFYLKCSAILIGCNFLFFIFTFVFLNARDVNINLPTAPEVGLYLDECFFTSYNQKWKDHEELSMKAYEKEAEFKMKYIYSHIASTEQKEGTVALWLHSLNHRNYPDLRVINEEAIPNNKSADPKEAITDNKSADPKDAITDNKGADLEEHITDNNPVVVTQ